MLKIGITGGIGSGKTTVCQLFEVLGIPTYYADTRAKQLMVENKTLIKNIKKLFGDAAYTESGALNRKHIAAIAFNDASKLAALNALVHPAVGRDASKWFKAQKDLPFALKEAALLFESGSYKKLDYIITVTAPVEIRVNRVKTRDGSSKKEIRARMNNQMNEKEKVERADFVIHNDGKHSLIQQVFDLYIILTTLSDTPDD